MRIEQGHGRTCGMMQLRLFGCKGCCVFDWQMCSGGKGCYLRRDKRCVRNKGCSDRSGDVSVLASVLCNTRHSSCSRMHVDR